jgi:hypothetical protein
VIGARATLIWPLHAGIGLPIVRAQLVTQTFGARLLKTGVHCVGNEVESH